MPPPPALPRIQSKNNIKKKQQIIVPMTCLERAMLQCEWLLLERDHDDIDLSGTSVCHLLLAILLYFLSIFKALIISYIT